MILILRNIEYEENFNNALIYDQICRLVQGTQYFLLRYRVSVDWYYYIVKLTD